MASSAQVRTTRDGDQFHYLWAARRCLRLLDAASDLKAVSVEGLSSKDAAPGARAGEEVVDVAEYYGAETLPQAREVHYLQLKHSTVRTDRDWTASGLTNTLEGFGLQHAELVGRHGEAEILAKVRYGFVSNRPVSAKVRASVRELGAGVAPTHARIAADLVKATKLPSALVPGFFGRLQFFDSEAKFSDQAGILTLEAANFLAGDDLDAALRLHRFVSDKATSMGKDEPAIRAGDVLLALRTGPNQLLPAPSHLVADPDAVPRRQEREIADSIARAATPVLILAPGGVGKSVLATRLPDLMPTGSETVLFDCFANGEYRHLTHQRHPHGKALVQIANELATRGLCLPLIPTAAADPQDYMRGLVDRLAQASLAVRARGPEALVVILVDAADNAQMAADEANTPAFVRDLLRQRLPDGVRLAMLCRPERVDMLKPPQAALSIPLSGFELDETAALLRRTYPDATEAQVEEFHRLSTQNPRVQDNALSTETGLKATLRSLGPNPTSVSATIGAQLARAVAKLKDETPGDGGDIDTLCVALAVLRPFIPLKVLEAMTGLSIPALHSFASDFGRGRWLLVSGDAVQFRDEPVETWFRETFSATRAQLETFLERLTPLADAFPYVATTLPALMLNCGRLDDLIALALSSERLPADSPLERREIQVERLRFALRASLEGGRHLDASKLAAKAAEETAGQARHEALIEANVDLVGALLEPDRLQETAARRTFGRGWLGGRYAREAALLSAAPELRGEASNRLQIAEDLLWAWSRLKTEAREAQAITDDDRADLMLAQLNLRGPRTAVKHLLQWRPPHIWFETGRRIASRLVDLGRFEDLEAMALAAGEHKAGPLVAAITLALSQVSRYPPKAAVEAAVALPKGGGPGPLRQDDWQVDTGRDAMTALVEAAVHHGYADRTRLVRLLGHVLPKSPPRSLGADFHRGRAGYLRAYALRAALRGRTLPLNDLASEEVRESLTRPGGYRSYEADEFKSRVGASWPWWELRAGILVNGEPADLAGAIAGAEKVSTAAYGYYGAERSVQDEIAVARFDILCRTAAPTTGLVADFDHWVELQKRPMFVQTWTRIARMAARHPELKAHAHRYAHRPVAGEWNETGETADSQIDTLIGASRALLALDREEAGLLLDGAIEVASRMGDEVYTRWEAVLALADAAGGEAPYDPHLAYRLSRCAEFTADYIEKHFPWGRTIDAMAGLSPASAIAVVSRWRDRDLTWYRDLGNALWATLRRRRLLKADLGIALAGYRYGWRLEALLDDALDPASNPAHPQTVFDIGVEAALIDGHSAKAWNAIVAAGAGQGLDVARAERARDAATAEEAREATRELAAKAEAAREAAPTTPTNAEAPPPPPAPLGRIRTIAEALAAEKARYGLDYDGDAFWRDAFAAVQGEDAAAFVRGALGPDGIDHYAQDRFFGALPEAWRERLAVKKALSDGMKAFARRNGWIMLQRSHWGPAPIAAAAERSGLTQAAVAQAALEGVAPEIERTGSDNLFNLSGFLARRLTAAEAREALDYSLVLIEAAMPEATGEGPWKPELAPAEDAERAMAGYIWGTLGAAERGLRWEAAHVVRRLCRLRQDRVLDELLRLAGSSSAGAFVSASLPFYHLDARQWLMIALARAALETPDAVARLADGIAPFAVRTHTHVVIRHYAAQAIATLEQLGALAPPPRDAPLSQINASRLPVHVSDRWYEGSSGPGRRKAGDRDFAFDHDMAKGMMDDLARAFRIELPEVERVANRIIRTDWGLDADGFWDGEPRRNQRPFKYADRTGRQVDRLSQYLTYHAVACAAGELLELHPVRRHREEADDDFTRWVRRRLITRDDGRWIADRRDPTPPLPDRPPTKPALWPWSVQRSDFPAAAGLDQETLTVWGSWTWMRDQFREQVDVRSALVSAATARALLSAGQTAPAHHDLHLPRAGDDAEITGGGYEMRGWVSDDEVSAGPDAKDPWAAEMSFPPPKPAPAVCTALGLQPFDDGRHWAAHAGGAPAFEADVWSALLDTDRDDYRPGGSRLRIARTTLPTTLATLGYDLMLQVRISRKLTRSGGDDRSGMIEYPQPYFMLYLMRQDGSVETFS